MLNRLWKIIKQKLKHETKFKAFVDPRVPLWATDRRVERYLRRRGFGITWFVEDDEKGPIIEIKKRRL